MKNKKIAESRSGRQARGLPFLQRSLEFKDIGPRHQYNQGSAIPECIGRFAESAQMPEQFEIVPIHRRTAD